jgi:hypothetical protein
MDMTLREICRKFKEKVTLISVRKNFINYLKAGALTIWI